MFTETIQTRFSDTDALGHINNTNIPVWFEGARDPIFRFFTPDLDPKQWHLILAKIEVEFLKELYYGTAIEIKTFIRRIGRSSFDVYQEAWQNNEKAASGVAIMVFYDHNNKKAQPLTDTILKQLNEHLISQD